MAIVTLACTFINLLSSGGYVSAFSQWGATSWSTVGEVRTYAGGRQRSITTRGERGEVSLALFEIPLSTINTLRSWVGQAVQVRDYRGRLFTGVFYKVDEVPTPTPNIYNVGLTLYTVTPE